MPRNVRGLKYRCIKSDIFLKSDPAKILVNNITANLAIESISLIGLDNRKSFLIDPITSEKFITISSKQDKGEFFRDLSELSHIMLSYQH